MNEVCASVSSLGCVVSRTMRFPDFYICSDGVAKAGHAVHIICQLILAPGEETGAHAECSNAQTYTYVHARASNTDRN